MGFFKILAFFGRLAPMRSEAPPREMTVHNLTRKVQLADRIQLAGDGHNRRKGLLGRKALARGTGLWIVPCEAVHTFGMSFPIDLIYLDRKHRIVKTRSNVRPWRLSACLTAHSVIELASGTIHDTRTQAGDVLQIETAAVHGNSGGFSGTREAR